MFCHCSGLALLRLLHDWPNFSQSEVNTQPKATVSVFRALMLVACIRTAFTCSFDYVPLLLLTNKIHSQKFHPFFCCSASL